MGLGPYPQVSLKEARTQASARLSEVRQGKDPIAERAAKTARSSAPSFGWCANQYISNQRQGWRNAKHAQQWTNTIEQYCAPILKKSIDSESEKINNLEGNVFEFSFSCRHFMNTSKRCPPDALRL
jgi:hypothetical protein